MRLWWGRRDLIQYVYPWALDHRNETETYPDAKSAGDGRFGGLCCILRALSGRFWNRPQTNICLGLLLAQQWDCSKLTATVCRWANCREATFGLQLLQLFSTHEFCNPTDDYSGDYYKYGPSLDPAQHWKIKRRNVNWAAGGQKCSCIKKEGVLVGAAHSTGLNCSETWHPENIKVRSKLNWKQLRLWNLN